MKTSHSQGMSAWVLVLICSLLAAQGAWAFCGFYAAKADAKLYNKSSQVIIARNGNHTVLTMANDYKGDVKEFALVVPVPHVLSREQIHIADPYVFEKLDAYTAPRLAEYYDADDYKVYTKIAIGLAIFIIICAIVYRLRGVQGILVLFLIAVLIGLIVLSIPIYLSFQASAKHAGLGPDALGVLVEAEYSVGEYDIVILSAEQSDGLQIWLTQNGYKIPAGAEDTLAKYIKGGMKFFVAKVNQARFGDRGLSYLSPIQMKFDSEKFMLPIQLGMVNADGEQDLTIYALTDGSHRLTVTNYPMRAIPTDIEVPRFIKDEFGEFYKAVFTRTYEQAGKKAVFTEYYGGFAKCDPCVVPPLEAKVLMDAGVFWGDLERFIGLGSILGGRYDVSITRLHLRYTPENFKEDLMFALEPDNPWRIVQARYVLRHPYYGWSIFSPAYWRKLSRRKTETSENLARLTGWSMERIKEKM